MGNSDYQSHSPVTWTYAEQTQQRWTVAEAIKAASARLGPDMQMCTDALLDRGHPRDHAAKITLIELNRLADKLVDDSLYYSGR